MSLAGSQPSQPPEPLGGRHRHIMQFRVRYSETDQMGTFYNSRPLEWFECGRTEILRSLGMTYAEMEARGLLLPLIEARVEYLGRARYDDLLEMTCTMAMEGRARLRWEAEITHAGTSQKVVRGHTLHAFTDTHGRPMRPPAWFHEFLRHTHPALQTMPGPLCPDSK